MTRGQLITIEGIDGAGKTTLATGLLVELQAKLQTQQRAVRLLREPGGVTAAERLRELVKDTAVTIGARAEALIYAAARAQLVEEALLPLLQSGTWVLLDRFIDSSLAYQGGGRQLGVDPVREINLFGTGGLLPDRTLLLSLDPALGQARSSHRGEPPDRLELENRQFFETIATTYAALAATDPLRIRTIDAAQPPEAVLAAAVAAVQDLV
ncbi:MAG: dTMP kinase [Solirubrobacteraceae bacterium]